MAEITVHLPVYNGVGFLDETPQSLRQQSFADFEVLCIDDCSDDGSADVIQRHAALNERIIYLHTGRNLGSAPRAVNFAAQQTKGWWFASSSQDDLFSQDWFARLHQRVLATGADAVLPDLVFYHADSPSGGRKIAGYCTGATGLPFCRGRRPSMPRWTRQFPAMRSGRHPFSKRTALMI